MLKTLINIFKASFRLTFYLSISFWVLFNVQLTAQNKTNFIHLSPKLENQVIMAEQAIQDSLGYIWITDFDGIYKYDGYDFKFTPFTHFFGEDYISKRKILFKKDKKGNFWLAPHKGGLVMINPKGAFKSFKESIGHIRVSAIEPFGDNVFLGTAHGVIYSYNLKNSKIDNLTTIPEIDGQSQLINDIAFTGKETLWLSTHFGNVYNFSFPEKRIQRFDSPFNQSIKEFIKLESNKEGILWLASMEQGLYKYSTEKKEFKEFNTPVKPYKHLMYLSMFADSSANIWIATDGNGLFKIDSKTEKISVFKHSKENKFSISNNTITHLSEDSQGNLWAVGKKGIINILPSTQHKIKYYSGSSNNVPTPVLSLLKASDESLWIGTDGEGINRVFPDGTSIQYDMYNAGNQFFKGRYIFQILEDSKKNILIATYQNGLFTYNFNSRRFKEIQIKDKSGRSYLGIRSLFIDSKNRIWASHDGGIHVFDENLNLITIFNYDSKGLSGMISESMIETKDGKIWISTLRGGLFIFEENNNSFKDSYFKKINYYGKTGNHDKSYDISFMSEDNQGNLWIRVQSESLIKLNVSSYDYELFANKENLKDLRIYTVLVDNSGALWLSSANGIHQYNPETEVLKSLYEVDGIQGNVFSRRAAYKDEQGIFYFGGEKGVTSFSPEDSFEKRNSSANLYINQIEILNKPASTIIPDQISKSIERVKSLKLKPNQSSFSFQFSAIDNVLNPNYHYSYRLRGFDNNWIVPKKERIATYTNIPPGDYVFEVKAGTKKGVWNINPKTIEINIAQPIWNTPWAHIFYVLIFLIFAYAIYLWIRLKNKLVSEELKYKNEKELYALKMNFFAKMSHEIQTPLTLISGPIENMLENAVDSGNSILRQRLSMISNNAKRLSKIVFELTTFRNKELGQLKLRVTENNIISDLKNITSSFKEQATFKKINFTCYFPDSEVTIWYDKDKVEHILYNLLANAFKFTPKEGFIDFEVKVLDSEDIVKISVTDSGPGISKNELENIFKLFYQSDTGKKNIGTGIGLALTKELVKLHKGKIDVVSSPKKGTCFSVFLPTNENIYTNEEKVFSKSDKKTKPKDENSGLEEVALEKKHSDKTILIVEDNYEMQIFLEDIFKDQYNILIADDGEEGLLLAKKHIPDLIISDIMMPNKDGLEMSLALQKIKLTSHIPIILLTAKESPKGKITGLMSGAIEYINKPFNSNELIFKVHNIISRSDKLLSKYRTDLISTPKNATAVSHDDIFLKRIMDIIEVEFKNPNFKLEELSDLLHMSYSAVYRKFQAITGKTLVDFLRSIRLKKGAILIAKYNYTVSETTFAVGFNDPKYFTKCFKKEFKMTPISFKKQAQTDGIDSFIKKYNLEHI